MKIRVLKHRSRLYQEPARKNQMEQEGGYFAHAVVTVGYEEFTHEYTTTEEYWLFGWKEKEVEHEDVYRYLRVIDGWSTSNNSRYVDFNGFYTTVKGIAFMLEE